MGRKSDKKSNGANVRQICCFIFFTLTSTPTIAEQQNNGIIPGQGYLLSGFATSDFKSPKALNSYQGIIYAPFGSLSETGLILRAWNKAYRFTYKTDLSRNARNIEISALGLSLEGEVGWQFANQQGRIALYGGIVWRDHKLTPNDSSSSLEKSRIGFSGTLDGEYKYSDQFGIMANASYLEGFDQYWTQIKPYVKFSDTWKIGFDGASFGGKDYHLGRAGVFVSDFEFSLWPLNQPMFLGAEVGVQFSFKDKQFNPYAGLSVGYLF